MYNQKYLVVMTDKVLDQEELCLLNSLNFNPIYSDSDDDSLSSDSESLSDDSESSLDNDNSSDESSLSNEHFAKLNYEIAQEEIQLAKVVERSYLLLRVKKLLSEDNLSTYVKTELNKINDLMKTEEFVVKDLQKHNFPKEIYDKLAYPRYVTKEESLECGYSDMDQEMFEHLQNIGFLEK